MEYGSRVAVAVSVRGVIRSLAFPVSVLISFSFSGSLCPADFSYDFDFFAPNTINPTPPASATPPKIGGSDKLFRVSAVMLTDPTSTNVSLCV